MSEREDLIWKYLDGQLDADDRKRVEDTLETDPSFRELYMQSEVLHQNLGALETEIPSMRFAQNVMDSLPAVRELATGPLVSVKWLRSFFGGTIALLLAFFSSGVAIAPAATAQENHRIDRMIDRFYALFELIPANIMIMAGIIMISLLVLLSLDRWLQKRFLRS
ncbi:anti-sigma factor family protein [Flavilitoribacter nigricans]|uniref:Zinc-finger domain-containing protein n=1 Tax=Flavilitoribacter nigricans (strain ATCC 23147 / DSM 23189 / NBRC 102662 / NCIMB 1420 / SS-2) TaxID=1122177 RepID=A0A2D0NDU3_FLAN2|nr:hypothetical protein [Flavilitoribacter nigricans]PHN06681.1 hypothetical protein CRP01_10315 [Flavilitoribacter nigricans DSM 23189 = NBRC 102662]